MGTIRAPHERTLNDAARRYRRVKDKIKELNTEATELREILLDAMDGAETLCLDDWVVTAQTVTQNRFDTARFKRAQPKLYQKYSHENEQVRVVAFRRRPGKEY